MGGSQPPIGGQTESPAACHQQPCAEAEGGALLPVPELGLGVQEVRDQQNKEARRGHSILWTLELSWIV